MAGIGLAAKEGRVNHVFAIVKRERRCVEESVHEAFQRRLNRLSRGAGLDDNSRDVDAGVSGDSSAERLHRPGKSAPSDPFYRWLAGAKLNGLARRGDAGLTVFYVEDQRFAVYVDEYLLRLDSKQAEISTAMHDIGQDGADWIQMNFHLNYNRHNS